MTIRKLTRKHALTIYSAGASSAGASPSAAGAASPSAGAGASPSAGAGASPSAGAAASPSGFFWNIYMVTAGCSVVRKLKKNVLYIKIYLYLFLSFFLFFISFYSLKLLF